MDRHRRARSASQERRRHDLRSACDPLGTSCDPPATRVRSTYLSACDPPAIHCDPPVFNPPIPPYALACVSRAHSARLPTGCAGAPLRSKPSRKDINPMTDGVDKPSQELTTQQRAAIGKTRPNGVSGRLKAALDDMTWNGTAWEEAALKANLTVRAMRLALKRPQVLRYLRAERGVLLASASSQNIHALARLRDQDEHRTAAVQAARTLEGLASDQFEPGSRGSGAVGARAGWMIDPAKIKRPAWLSSFSRQQHRRRLAR
jgi:hypothetical protein